MQLSEYLKSRNISVADFALQIGARSRATVHRYIKGDRLPRKATIQKIHAITGGAVTLADFYELGAPPIKKRNGARHA